MGARFCLVIAASCFATACTDRGAVQPSPPNIATSGHHASEASASHRGKRNAYTETVLYSFGAGSAAPRYPSGPIFIGPASSYYGTTNEGGSANGGVAYKRTSAGMLVVLHAFVGGTTDAAQPQYGVIRDSSGNLYGTTLLGVGYHCYNEGCGTVYELSPTGAGYSERFLHQFIYNHADGVTPWSGLTVDSSGNMFGVTLGGGGGMCHPGVTAPIGCGTVYELSPSGTGFTYRVLHGFSTSEGNYPMGNVAVDSSGNIFGTTEEGGTGCSSNGGCGTVFELTPSGSTYTMRTIYEFQGKANGDGSAPKTGVIVSGGNLYGTTFSGGATGCRGGCGTIFQLTTCIVVTCAYPYKEGWLYEFPPSYSNGYSNYSGPTALVADSSGNLFGATGYGSTTGTVFETSASTGSTSTIFTFPGAPDGSNPGGSLVLGSGGVLFGVTLFGDGNENGLIYKLSASSSRK